MSTGTYKSSSHGAMEFQLQKYHVKYLIRETVFYNGRNTDLVHRERLVLTRRRVNFVGDTLVVSARQ